MQNRVLYGGFLNNEIRELAAGGAQISLTVQRRCIQAVISGFELTADR